MSDVNLGAVYTNIDLDAEPPNQRVGEEVLAAWNSIPQGAAQASSEPSAQQETGFAILRKICYTKAERKRKEKEEGADEPLHNRGHPFVTGA